MNMQNMRLLVQRLRAPASAAHFNLSYYFNTDSDAPRGEAIHTCGTVACIAGFAAVLAKPTNHTGFEFEEAMRWLDLTGIQASALFTPSDDRVNYGRVTASIAADVVEHLANTGEVVWPASVSAS